MKKIIVSGCSMASGFECTQLGVQWPRDYKFAWPTVLANKLEMEVINLSRPGISNQTIWHQLATNLDHITTDDFVIIAWTDLAREDYQTENSIWVLSSWLGDRLDDAPASVKSAWTAWVNADDSYRFNSHAWLAWTAHEILKTRNIKHLMFNSISPLGFTPQDLTIPIANNQSSPMVWNSVIEGGYYLNPLNGESTQFAWLSKNCPELRVSQDDNHRHWNAQGLQQWADHLYEPVKKALTE